mgnify:CR=1 FL=1
MTRERYTFAQESCLRLTGKLMQRLEMLHPGARVGVAISGGVDSWALLKVLALRRGIVPFPFEIMALHVNPGFEPDNHEIMGEWLASNGISAHLEVSDHGPLAHSAENMSNSPCFYCARLRRKRLFSLCRDYKLTHLAFGHTAEDLVTNFFMNMIQGGRVDGLAAKDAFFGGELMVIRPMLLLEKPMIIKAARDWGLPVRKNPCPSSDSCRRSVIGREMDGLFAVHKGARRNIYNALRRWNCGLT